MSGNEGEITIYTLEDVKNLPDNPSNAPLKLAINDFLAANPHDDMCKEKSAYELGLAGQRYDVLPVEADNQIIGLIGIKHPDRFMAFYRERIEESTREAQKINETVYVDKKEEVSVLGAHVMSDIKRANTEKTPDIKTITIQQKPNITKNDHINTEQIRMIYQNRWNDILRKQNLIATLGVGIVIPSSRIAEAGIKLKYAQSEMTYKTKPLSQEKTKAQREELIKKLRGCVSSSNKKRLAELERRLEHKGHRVKDAKTAEEQKQSIFEFLRAKRAKEKKEEEAYSHRYRGTSSSS